MKKKLILATCGFPWGKGEKTFIIPELSYLKKQYDITIIAWATDKIVAQSEWKTEIDDSMRVMRYDPEMISTKKKIVGSIRALFSPLVYREIIRVIQSKGNVKEQIVESIGYYVFAYEYAKWLKKKGVLKKDTKAIFYSYWSVNYHLGALLLKKHYPKLKVISRMHGMDLYNERYKGGRQPFKWKLDEASELLIFASEYGKKYYLKNFSSNLFSDKYKVCKLGINGANINCKHNGEVWKLVSCSNVIPLKRVELIVGGLSKIHEIPIEWVHFGGGEGLAYIRKMAAERLPANIKADFRGHVSNELIRQHYETEYVDCFITTSSTEGGCPVSIMEAMSASVPIIGTDVGGISEMIGTNGILLSSNPSIEEIADAICEMYKKDKEEIERMRDESRELWNKNYNIEKNAKRILRLLNNLY